MPGFSAKHPWNDTVGQTVPPDTPHAVSVSLPTWESNVAYEEGERWVLDKMMCGYPRFFIHKSIDKLALSIVQQHASPETEKAMLVPTRACAKRCRDFLLLKNLEADPESVRILDYVSHPERTPPAPQKRVLPHLNAVIYPKELWPTAKVFWQHTGEGISSRHAEFCQKALDEGVMVEASTLSQPTTPRLSKGPRRYQRPVSIDHGISQTTNGHSNGHTNGDTQAGGESGVKDSALFVEERFGRNLDVAFAAQCKVAIRRRIAGSLSANEDLPQALEMTPEGPLNERSRDVPGFSVDDVYLFPNGMNAIFHAHRSLKLSRGELPSVMYGFPYVDTLKVLEKFGPGVTFYGHGS